MAAPSSRTRPAIAPASKSGSPITLARLGQARKHALDIAAREEFDVHVRMMRTKQPQFAILTRIVRRLLHREFDEEIVFRQIKVGSKELDRLAGVVERNRKHPGFI